MADKKTSFNPFPKQALAFMCLQYKSFEKTVGKGEIAHKEQFHLLPISHIFFNPFWELSAIFIQIQYCHLQTHSAWKTLKLVVWERVKKKGDSKVRGGGGGL